MRWKYANNASAVDLTKEMPGHVDIPRLKKGKVGGFFWYVIVIETSSCDLLTNPHASRSTYVSCPDPLLEGRNFLGATWRVRDTLEQIDIAKLLIEKYPDVCRPFSVSVPPHCPSVPYLTFVSVIPTFALLANEYRTGFILTQQTFQLALSSDDIKNAILTGKIASLLGVEGLVAF